MTACIDAFCRCLRISSPNRCAASPAFTLASALILGPSRRLGHRCVSPDLDASRSVEWIESCSNFHWNPDFLQCCSSMKTLASLRLHLLIGWYHLQGIEYVEMNNCGQHLPEGWVQAEAKPGSASFLLPDAGVMKMV